MDNNQEQHGLSIGLEECGDVFYLTIKAVGKLTHKDYEYITPILDKAMDNFKDDHLNILIDISQFQGWELSAAWDDFKLGIKYNLRFNKIALYGENDWIDSALKITNWFTNANIKHFKNELQALAWMQTT
jgi:hypothetical protein